MLLTSTLCAFVLGQQSNDLFEHIGSLPNPMSIGTYHQEAGIVEIIHRETKKRGALRLSDNMGVEPVYDDLIVLTADLILTGGGADSSVTWTLHTKAGEVKSSTTAKEVGQVYYKVNDDAYIFRTADDKYAVYDGEGVKLTQDYQSLRPFGDAAISVLQDERIGIRTPDDQEIIPFSYHDVRRVPGRDVYIAANTDKKYGLIKADGTEVIPYTYRYIQVLLNGLLLLIEENENLGLTTFEGKEISPVQARNYSNSKGRYMGWWSKDGSDSGILDTETGENVYDGGSSLQEIFQLTGDYFLTYTKEIAEASYNSFYKYRKIALVDAKKGALTPSKYYDIKFIETADGPVFELYDIEEKLQYFWLMNKDGKMIAEQVEPTYRESNGKTFIKWKGPGVTKESIAGGFFTTHPEGVVDYQGRDLFPGRKLLRYPEYSEGLGFAMEYETTDQGRKGYMNINGDFIIVKPEFERGDRFRGGLASVSVDDPSTEKFGWLKGVIDKTGIWVIPPKYEFVTRHETRPDLFICQTKSGMDYLLTSKGQEIFKANAASLTFLGEDLFLAEEKAGQKRSSLFRIKG
jgi:hypothetical protein